MTFLKFNFKPMKVLPPLSIQWENGFTKEEWKIDLAQRHITFYGKRNERAFSSN